MAKRVQNQYTPRKPLSYPADWDALQGYAGILRQARAADHASRMAKPDRAAERAAVKNSFIRKGRSGKPKPQKRSAA
jgi:hypothetical protein